MIEWMKAGSPAEWLGALGEASLNPSIKTISMDTKSRALTQRKFAAQRHARADTIQTTRLDLRMNMQHRAMSSRGRLHVLVCMRQVNRILQCTLERLQVNTVLRLAKTLLVCRAARSPTFIIDISMFRRMILRHEKG